MTLEERVAALERFREEFLSIAEATNSTLESHNKSIQHLADCIKSLAGLEIK